MDKEDRVRNIMSIIQKKKRISVGELAKLTFSSISTLRRDLIYIEDQGLIKRKYGHVLLNTFNTIETSHAIRETENRNEKKIIANLAKDFIGPGMCIYLDSSTTVYELCQYICHIDNLIIFTNGLTTALALSDYASPNTKIFITSGEIKRHSSSVVNQDIQNSLINHFNIDLAFCSARGIDANFVYEVSFSQAVSKKNIIDKAKETILLLDSSKFNQTGFFKINTLSKYKAIISDKLPDCSILNSTEKLGIEWISH